MRDAEYWRKKAEKYQRDIETASWCSLGITTRTVLRRGVMIRKQEGSKIQEYFLSRTELRIRRLTGAFPGPYRGSLKLFRTLWYVVSVHTHGVVPESFLESFPESFPEHTVHHWNQLAMAQAHRDGRNYHYAKYLMTGSRY